jgi:hypothetical protein
VAQESRAVYIKYDEQSAQQRAKLAATHSSNVQRYEGLRAAADAAYQKLKAFVYHTLCSCFVKYGILSLQGQGAIFKRTEQIRWQLLVQSRLDVWCQ